MTFVCPRCKGPLETHETSYTCTNCIQTYPIVMGIPDFRVFDDPWIEKDDDYAKAARIAERYDDLSFEELCRYYWLLTPDTPPDLAERYVRHVLGGVDRGRSSLDEIERLTGDIANDSFLEFGCGTGGFLIAAQERFGTVIGTEIAFRWLILAKKRLEEAGITNVLLVCCCGQYLPFPDHQFDLVVASDVIEHTEDQVGLVRQGMAGLRKGGRLFLATPNRTSLSPEPHVRVWGVGFLPRSLMPRYVKLVRGIEYQHIRTVSYPELRTILVEAGCVDFTITLPEIPDAELFRYSKLERRLLDIYHAVVRTPVVRLPLYAFGPLFHVVCRAD